MGSSKHHTAVSLALTVLAVSLSAGSPDSVMLSSAARVSAAMIPAPFPRGEFAPLTATFYPAVYYPHTDSGLRLLPVIGFQWWVSPNLAIVGGLGSGLIPQDAGLTGQQVVQLSRVGLKYLPESLALGPFRPEITLARNGIEGLPDYRLTWNEASWVYSARFGSVNIACALLFLYQSIFPRSEAEALDVPGKLEATTRMLALSAGYDLFRGLRLSVQAKVGSGLVTGGIQLSLAV